MIYKVSPAPQLVPMRAVPPFTRIQTQFRKDLGYPRKPRVSWWQRLWRRWL